MLQEVAAGGAVLMGRLVDGARNALINQEAALRDPRLREVVTAATSQLRLHEQQMCQAFPAALLSAFAGGQPGKKAPLLSVVDVQYDQLELMDEEQVQTSITLARIQQSVLQVAESSLSELNTLVCSLLGMATVRAEQNPLRPDHFINALQDVVGQTQQPAATQQQWFNALAGVMGPELRKLYGELCTELRAQGVLPVSFASPAGSGAQGGVQAHGGGTGAGPAAMGQGHHGGAAAHPGPEAYAGGFPDAGAYGHGSWGGAGDTDDDPENAFQTQAAPLMEAPIYGGEASLPRGRENTLLTLDKLRRLLVGELASASNSLSRVERFAAQFAQQFGDAAPAAASAPPKPGFDPTVPAALEALTEMRQVDRVVQNLEQRRGSTSSGFPVLVHTVEGQRQSLRQQARDVAQALSLEVVTLMVDNMARDPRLLEPVSHVIRKLEPALLRLVLVDQRFFSDKQHPARRLLHELTEHSLAFDSSVAAGFAAFLQGLKVALEPLYQGTVDNAEVFEQTLQVLQRQWSEASKARAPERELAVDLLAHAEARNLLAEEIARGIEAHPDSTRVPSFVIDFLCGPWAQVVAQARIKLGPVSPTTEKFEALVPAMQWSAHPELARTDPSKLARVVPRLLATLREGLETIEYPATRTSVFLESLMAVHQQVFRASTPTPAPRPSEAPSTPPKRAFPVLDGDPWVAPEEARASNFVELQEASTEPVPAEPEHTPDLLDAAAMGSISADVLQLGSWVELWSNGQWARTQLTWASPHGTLFLFTGVFGATQSMTRRSRDKLLATGRLRLVSGESVDAGALNAVVQTAIRNSVDSVF